MSQRLPYKITLIHPSAGVNQSGGSEVIAIELARRLNEYFNVTLLSGAECGSFSYPIKCIQRTRAKPVVDFPLISSILKKRAKNPEIVIEHLTSFIPCFSYLLHNPPDLIFPHNSYGGLAVAVAIRYFTSSPILFTEHNGFLANGKCLKRDLRFKPDRLVVFEETLAEKARQFSPDQPISVIPNGIDLDRFSPGGTRIETGLAKPLILCVASLHRNNHKRVELAIRAVARLPEASLLICGAGPDQSYFQALGNDLLGESRFSIRTFPFERMPEVYRSADIFTLPSVSEPFACAYLEAMASGLPIVTTDDEVRRYMVGDGGFLCDVTNIEEYSAALEATFNQNWGNRPRKSALRFDWNNVILRYKNLIIDVLKT